MTNILIPMNNKCGEFSSKNTGPRLIDFTVTLKVLENPLWSIKT